MKKNYIVIVDDLYSPWHESFHVEAEAYLYARQMAEEGKLSTVFELIKTFERVESSEFIAFGGTGRNEKKPNCCIICKSKPMVRMTQSIMGQYLFGLCEEHKGCNANMSSDGIGFSDKNGEVKIQQTV